MRVLKVMAEVGVNFGDVEQLPLWEGHTLAEDVRVTPTIQEVALRWNNWYEKLIHEDVEVTDDFVQVGRNLAANIKMDLGEGVEIWYYNESTQKDELIK